MVGGRRFPNLWVRVWAFGKERLPSLGHLGRRTLAQRPLSLIHLNSSKHLKGQLDPPVGNVTFLDQRRSVGPPCW